MKLKRELDVVIISDVHLGTQGSHAKELLRYLKSIKTKLLIINGDFIDGWEFNKKYWPKEHTEVLRKILKFSEKNKVIWISGNHDEFLRKYTPFILGNIEIVDRYVLTLDNKKIFIHHGDIFDSSISKVKIIAHLGSFLYDFLIGLNIKTNKILNFFGKPNINFSKKIKNSIKSAVNYINNFELVSINDAKNKNYDAVCLGHIHNPQIKNYEGILYLNSGDWIENLSALEYKDNNWNLYKYINNDK